MKPRVALVTGGTGAIGTEICKHLGAAGHRVAALGHPSEAERIPAWRLALREAGVEVAVELCDAGDFEAAGVAIRRIEAQLGPVEILVNAAGITRDARLVKMTPEQWRQVMSANLDSVFNATKAVFEGMCARGYGRIVNISSVNAIKGQFGQTNYSAAKAGMAGFSKALAQEVVKKGVTVNTVSPGYVETDMVMAIRPEIREQIVASIPMGRLAKPQEIAAVVAFLVSEEAGYITGANISVNGGMHMM